MKSIGTMYVAGYHVLTRAVYKVFSLLISGAFAGFGKDTVVAPPLRLSGAHRICIGKNVYLGPSSWLQALSKDKNESIAISIGDGTSVVGACVISAVRSVV